MNQHPPRSCERLLAALEPFALLWTEIPEGEDTHVPCSIRRDDLARAGRAYLEATREPRAPASAESDEAAPPQGG